MATFDVPVRYASPDPHLRYASPCLAENVTFVFGEKVYQVDKHIILLAQGLFQHLRIQFVPFTHGSLKLAYLAPTSILTKSTLDCVLSFFEKGKFDKKSAEKVDQLKRIAETYQLSLLTVHLETLSGNLKREQISLADQLKMSALKQDPQLFFEILCQMSENSAGKWDQEQVCQAVVYFRPQAFAILMKDFIGVEQRWAYDDLLEAYVKKQSFLLENAILLFEDHKWRLDCLAHFPLNRRLAWCQLLTAQVSTDFLQKSVLSPLVEAKRLIEAREWVQKTQDSHLALFLIEVFMQNGLGKEAEALFSLVPTHRRQEIEQRYIVTTLEFMCAKEKPTLQDPFEAVKTIIKLYCRCRESIHKYSKTKISLMDYVIAELKNTFHLTPTPALISTILELFIQHQVSNLQQNVIQDLKKAKPDVQAYEFYFHPAFQEDLTLLQYLAYTLESEIEREFGSSEGNELLKDLPLKGRALFEEILRQVRLLYCRQRSLEEDFIIQLVSAYIQPFIFLQRSEEWKSFIPSIDEKPFMEKFQDAFKKMGFGDQLSADQWDVALYAYIRKCVEAANFKLYYPGNERIDIYSEEYQAHIICEKDPYTGKITKLLETILSSEQQEVSNLIEGLTIALKRDFPLDRMTNLSAKSQQLLSDSVCLKQEVLVKLLQAQYRITAPPAVQYERYIANTPPATPLNTPSGTPTIRRAEVPSIPEKPASPQNDESQASSQLLNGTSSSEPPITPPKPRRSKSKSIRAMNHSTLPSQRGNGFN